MKTLTSKINETAKVAILATTFLSVVMLLNLSAWF
jgi:hypothetical protein